jgi:hypothetical protein
MGIPFYKPADWSAGTSSAGPETFQNDTAVIAGAPNDIGYRKNAAPRSPDKINTAVKIEKQQAGSIDLSSSGDYAYRLFDISGRLLTQGNLRKGWNQIQAQSLPNTVLVLQWYGESGSVSQKLIR